jgi:photosystem II stability/assembly factor-like uncharacterized protein
VEQKAETKPVWMQSQIGGGGLITGLLQHPASPETIYARCDVAGVFASLDGGSTWEARNQGMELCHEHSVQAFAIHPSKPEVLLRCSGEPRGGKMFGSIHKSTDGGATWYRVSEEVDFYGNGPTRRYSEAIAFGCANPDFVVAGGYSEGVYTSRDEGETWNYSGLKGERITTVMIHPRNSDIILVGTCGDDVLGGNAPVSAEAWERYQDHPRGPKGRLYRSLDGAKSWERVLADKHVLHLHGDNSEEVMYAACHKEGLFLSRDLGRTWEPCSKGLDERLNYHHIAQDPGNDQVFYTVAFFGSPSSFKPMLPLFKSEDRCQTWTLLKEHRAEDISNYSSYLPADFIRYGIAKIRVDAVNSSKLYLSNYFGVYISEDGGATWDAHHFKGLEITCCENIVAHPTVPGKLYVSVADYSPKITKDHGLTYQASQAMSEEHCASMAAAPSRFDEGFMLYSIRGSRNAIIRSQEDGQEEQLSMALVQGLYAQAIAEDPHTPGAFYAAIDGSLQDGAGLYRTEDWGQSWGRLTNPLPPYIKHVPHERYLIENDLFSVVSYQTKNACGTNQLLKADPHRQGTVYFGEWTEGLYRSQDQGHTWMDISHNLPFRSSRVSVLSTIVCDERLPGVLYAGFIREGLWRSTNGGESWDKLYPKGEEGFNATSIVLGGADGRDIYVASEPLNLSPCPSRVIRSVDEGQSWTDLYDGSMGALRWKGIAWSAGRLHGVTCGNGALYMSEE